MVNPPVCVRSLVTVGNL